MLTAAVEPIVHKYLTHRALQTPDAIVHAIGGVENQVHMAVTLPPTIEISNWIGELKGSSAHHINHGPLTDRLAWQTG